MEDGLAKRSPKIESFETHPDRYRHWTLEIADDIATLSMDVNEGEALDGVTDLVLNLSLIHI